MIRHSIISWDSSFRNFFHLLPALDRQEYNLGEVECIFVEQRKRQTAEGVCRAVGTLPVHEVVERLVDRLDIELLYLDEEDDSPYHPGKLLNAGLKKARGEIVSTMDADILVPPHFLATLDMVHQRGEVIACMHRYTASFPCGVTRENWTNQIIDYDLIKNTCPDRHIAIPAEIGNKAPLLSARKSHWERLGGYDSHRVFSTAYTLFGRDISARFKLLLGNVEVSLPVASVHPWHPTEVSRGNSNFQVLYGAQQALIEWSLKTNTFDVGSRKEVADRLYEEHRVKLESAIAIAEQQMRESTRGGGGS